MEISGKIINVLPERSGVSQRSGTPWKAGSFIVETIEQFPKKCVFDVFGEDRLKQFNIQVGQMLTVSIDIDAHEYNGRWFNSIRAWKVAPYDPNAVAAPVVDPATGFAPGTQPAPMPGQPAAAQGAPAPAAPFPSAAPADPFAAAAPADPVGGVSESTDDLPF